MGREAEGHAVWRGDAGAVRAYLESDGIILRGDVRAKLRRAGLMDWQIDGEDLCLRSEGEPLVLTLGAKEAAAWVRALEKPVPGLAAKLGISSSQRAHVIGGPAPEELALALAGCDVRSAAEASLLVAVLAGSGDLEAALKAGQAAGLRVWCVHGKGKAAAVSDASTRAVFRSAGWMDIKSCAVSEAFTATLYRPPVG